jgi:hypothetical protein
VRDRWGGSCRPIAESERKGLEKRPQAYPQEYLAWQVRFRPGYPPQGYEPGPGVWRGDSYRAAFLIARWLADQGRPYAQVVDTGRSEILYYRQWRIFFARWSDGGRARIAVRFSRREGGTYFAMQSFGGVAWGQPQPIGQ